MKIIVIFLSIILFSACGPSQNEYAQMQLENMKLRDSLNLVVSQLEAYKFSPDKLCSNINQLYQDNNLASLDSIKNILAEYHPECDELKTVNGLILRLKNQQEKRLKDELNKRMSAVNKLKKTYDDVSNITWYKNPYFNHYNNTNNISIYIGQKDSSVWLRLIMSYEGDDWIFFDNAYLSYDGNTHQVFFNKYKDKKSDNSGGSVWEWIDVSVDEEMYKFLCDYINGKSLKMRLSGKYTETRNLSKKEISAMKDVLLAYDVLRNGQ